VKKARAGSRILHGWMDRFGFLCRDFFQQKQVVGLFSIPIPIPSLN
jgi:hypothetical protein